MPRPQNLTADEWRGWLEPRKKNGKKLLDRCLLQMPVPFISNVNINFYVNKYLLRSWLGVKLQARLWGHNGEQDTGSIKPHHLQKTHPYRSLILLVHFQEFAMPEPCRWFKDSIRGPSVPSRNLQSSWKSKMKHIMAKESIWWSKGMVRTNGQKKKPMRNVVRPTLTWRWLLG